MHIWRGMGDGILRYQSVLVFKMQDIDNIPWEAVAYVKSSWKRTEVLKHLAQQPQAASEISSKIDLNTHTISVAIGQMREASKMGENHDIVRCLTPDRSNFRIYGLTEDGEKVVRQLGEYDGT